MEHFWLWCICSIFGVAKVKVILTALWEELPYENICGYQVINTGVGKVNAAMAAMKVMGWMPYAEHIVNFGTAGAINKKISGLVKPDVIIQRDMIAEPQAPRGYTPFEEGYHAGAIVMGTGSSITLGTGDSFVMEHDPWFDYANIDLVDMEAYALAKCFLKHNKQTYGGNFECYKWVSDFADENAAETWVENQSAGAQAFINEVESWT